MVRKSVAVAMKLKEEKGVKPRSIPWLVRHRNINPTRAIRINSDRIALLLIIVEIFQYKNSKAISTIGLLSRLLQKR
ncbi:MAG: hypothetical protein AB7V56_04545 [Candidatus Nitrosocosmicus sp.]